MKVQPINKNQPPVKMLVRDFKQRKANAYARGQFGAERESNEYLFAFEEEAYQAGIRDSLTVKQWLEDKD